MCHKMSLPRNHIVRRTVLSLLFPVRYLHQTDRHLLFPLDPVTNLISQFLSNRFTVWRRCPFDHIVDVLKYNVTLRCHKYQDFRIGKPAQHSRHFALQLGCKDISGSSIKTVCTVLFLKTATMTSFLVRYLM